MSTEINPRQEQAKSLRRRVVASLAAVIAVTSHGKHRRSLSPRARHLADAVDIMVRKKWEFTLPGGGGAETQ